MRAYDVVIVGAGPAGSATAIMLARRGHSVAILDKEKFPREKLCGDFINPSNWPTLRRLGVAEEVLAASRDRISEFRITSYLGAEARVPLPDSGAGAGYGVALRRSTLDAILLRRAKCDGAVIWDNCKFKTLHRCRDGWSIVVENDQGPDEIVAQVVIGADGRNSKVAHDQGLSRALPRRGDAVGFQLHVKSSYDIAGKIEIHLFPGGYGGMAKIDHNLINFSFAVDRLSLENCGGLEALLSSRVQKNASLKELLRGGERIGPAHSTYPVYFSPRRCYSDRLLLVGDAARVSEPITGEGVYFALRSGVFAGDALHAAFQTGDLSSRTLQSYACACRAAFAVRRGLNALVRFMIYRPALLTPFLRFSARRQQLLNLMVRACCVEDVTRPVAFR